MSDRGPVIYLSPEDSKAMMRKLIHIDNNLGAVPLHLRECQPLRFEFFGIPVVFHWPETKVVGLDRRSADALLARVKKYRGSR